MALLLSSGEVKGLGLVNRGTGLPDESGLFSQRIFGPVETNRCRCKRYVGKRYLGLVCDRCGVLVGDPRERTRRFGHIVLPTLVVHPLAVGPLAALLGVGTEHLWAVATGTAWMRLRPDPDGLLVLTKQAIKAFPGVPNRFCIEITPTATGTDCGRSPMTITSICGQIHWPATRTLAYSLPDSERTARERVLHEMDTRGATWQTYCLSVLLVPPPSSRPLIMSERGPIVDPRNELYLRVLARAARMQLMREKMAPMIIQQDVSVGLQRAVTDVMLGQAVHLNATPIPGVLTVLKSKTGLLRRNLLGKRVDYSGRSVVSTDPTLPLDCVGIPRAMAYVLFRPFILRDLLQSGAAPTYLAALRLYRARDESVLSALDRLAPDLCVMLNRQPTLHRYGFMALNVRLVDGLTIRIPPMLCAPYNMDFDGDQVAVHVPLSPQAQDEARVLMAPSRVLRGSRDGTAIIAPSHEMVFGLYAMTNFVPAWTSGDPLPARVERSWDRIEHLVAVGALGIAEPLRYRPQGVASEVVTCAGRLWVEHVLGEPVTAPLDKGRARTLVEQAARRLAPEDLLQRLGQIQRMAFAAATQASFSLKVTDCVIPSSKAQHLASGRAEVARLTPTFLPERPETGTVAEWGHQNGTGLNGTQSAIHLDSVSSREEGNLKDIELDETNRLFPTASWETKEGRGTVSACEAENIRLPNDMVSAHEVENRHEEWLAAVSVPETENTCLPIGDPQSYGVSAPETENENDQKAQARSGDNYEQTIRIWAQHFADLRQDFLDEAGPDNPLVVMARIGARASMTQIAQIAVGKGLVTNAANRILPTPITESLREGLSPYSYFLSCNGSRKSMADKIFATPRAGYLTRRLVSALRDLYVVEDECDYPMTGAIPVSPRLVESGGLRDRLVETAPEPTIRSPVFCRAYGGLCQRCYGPDPATGTIPPIGTPVGVIAAQSLSEPSTQLALRQFHLSGVATVRASTLVVRASQERTITAIDHIPNTSLLWVMGDGQPWYCLHRDLASVQVRTGDRVTPGQVLAVYKASRLLNADIVNALTVLEGYFELVSTLFPATAHLAPRSGTVTLVPSPDGVFVGVDGHDASLGPVVDLPVIVAQGQRVRAGDSLTSGETDLKAYHAITNDLAQTAGVFLSRVHAIYAEEGVVVDPIHLEVAFRALTELVEIRGQQRLGFRRFTQDGNPLLLGLTTVNRRNPSWLGAAGFGYIRKVLEQAFWQPIESCDLPSERLMMGNFPLMTIPTRNDKDAA